MLHLNFCKAQPRKSIRHPSNMKKWLIVTEIPVAECKMNLMLNVLTFGYSLRQLALLGTCQFWIGIHKKCKVEYYVSIYLIACNLSNQ